ncbi:helix-turn-helix domain-containing protein [Paeniglutamicibacter sp.]|uniref:helix-turn-helix domain-containing protein n=1 Tax=Paeniglutamicibacter sp. TaxID=1934391 RepID=UPI0039899387
MRIRDLINGSPLSKNAIARRAGLAPSTVVRIGAGQLDPTLGTAQAIAQALGHQLPQQLPALCDPEAVRTARAMVSGQTTDGPWVQTLERWAGPKGTPRDLAREAGRAAPLNLRTDITTTRSSWNFLRIVGAVDLATSSEYALSGWPAAAMLGTPEQPEQPVIIYVDGGVETLGLALPDDPYGSTVVQILPFDGSAETGAQAAAELMWADPIQVALDLYADPATEHLGDQLFDILEESSGA